MIQKDISQKYFCNDVVNDTANDAVKKIVLKIE
jgi:hypothetical protein